MGFATPVVHTLTYGNRIFFAFLIIKTNVLVFFYKIMYIKFSANAQILYLASNVAKPKVKGIDGEFFQLWII